MAAPSVLETQPSNEVAGVASGSAGEGRPGVDSPLRIDRMVRTYHTFVWRTLRRLGLTEDEADDGAQGVFVTAAIRAPRLR